MLRRAVRSLLRPGRRLLLLYLALLALSHLVTDVILHRSPPPPGPAHGAIRSYVSVPAFNDAGAVDGRITRLAYLRWRAQRPTDQPRPPIILLHGSPSGGASDFADLGPLLADHGYPVYAIDLPGFGESARYAPSYSIIANARLTLAFMDALEIPRAHLIGWSLGGGAIIYADDFAPERVASLTLLASVGAQESEGSGDYYFEHAKYAVGYFFLVVLPELVPHFGALGPRELRHAFIRNFWDTDQRPVREIMERIETPTLILHGRRDPLVPAWGAELHYEIIQP
ncbi:MAG: alpha/beta fold hydrolase, partial [Planctomycetota bacterium]|nr:alpha/beta fold hydrolase [Planctomycetota bacterium]